MVRDLGQYKTVEKVNQCERRGTTHNERFTMYGHKQPQYERFINNIVRHKYTENISSNEKALLLVIRNMLIILSSTLSLPWSSLATF